MDMQISFENGRYDRSALRGRRIFVVSVVLIVTLFGYLSLLVRSELAALATSSSDNIQWSLSQTEVDYLAFVSEMQRASMSQTPDLKQVRRRFDVFFSRIMTLETGTIYTDLIDGQSNVSQSFRDLTAFRDKTVKTIDSSDDDLIASLPELIRLSYEVKSGVRDIALQGIHHFTGVRDQHRHNVYRTLTYIAIVAASLMLVLLILVYFLNESEKTSQSRLNQNELANARLSAIISTSLDAIIAIDGSGRLIEFNGAAEDIFGHSREQAIGQHMVELIIPEHLRARHESGMVEYERTGGKKVVGKGRIRLEAKHRDGRTFPIEFSVNEMPSAPDRTFVAYLRDISKESEAEQELRSARDSAVAGERSKSRMLAVMSHEMRTPLNGLLGTLELLSQTSLNTRQTRYIQAMSESGHLLLSHVNDVLDISRIDARKMDFESKIFDLDAAIHELLLGQESVAKERNIRLVFRSLEQTSLSVKGDRFRLQQVLLNLIGNAVKFTKNGCVEIEIERLNYNNLIEVRVSDDGVGIDATDLDSVFADFTTLDSSYGRESEGTGLGLGIARRITRAMGGEIGVESELGEGSMFWVRFPIDYSDAEPEQGEVDIQSNKLAGNHSTGNRLKILLVEDNEINRFVARDFLEQDGHSVTEARDGEEGVDFANQIEFDLILMDISMPKLDGVAATKIIRHGSGLSKRSPIFAFTAHALEVDLNRFLESGMNQVVSKPVSKKALLQAIDLLHDRSLKPHNPVPKNDRVLDIKALGEFRTDIGPERFAKMYQKYVAEMNDTIGEMTNASLDNKAAYEEISRTAHRLSGSTALFGAIALYNGLKRLEAAAKNNDEKNVTRKVQEVFETWLQTREALSVHVK